MLSNFTNALQSYEASPSDSTLAGAAVAAAVTLAQGLNSATATVNQVREQADSGIATSVQTINSLLTQFQTANAQIVNGTATGADVTNAQDTRDNILTQLAQQIGITTTTGANGNMSIYTDSGVTLFQGGAARSVTFSPTNTYTAVDDRQCGVCRWRTHHRRLGVDADRVRQYRGLANLRDNLTVTYQAQLDGMAGALINTFAESDQTGSGPNLPGLFTTPGATSLPTSTTGLAGQISVNASVDPSQGGNALLLRDGGISGIPTTPTTQAGTQATQPVFRSCLAICRRPKRSAPLATSPPVQA